MKTRAPSLYQLSEDVLDAVHAAERVKVAERQVVREVMPSDPISAELHKLASMVRAESNDITYDDLESFMRGAQ